MDPNETLRLWRESKSQSERREYIGYLREWLQRGGFAPEGLTGRERRVLGIV